MAKKKEEPFIHVEISGGQGVITPEQYPELRSDIRDVLGMAGFYFEGSGFGVFGVDYGWFGDTLTLSTLQKLEAVIQQNGFELGPEPENFVIVVAPVYREVPRESY